MPVGIIKFYNANKGFGFIAQEKGKDVFFHISSSGLENPESLEQGQIVSFEIERGAKGPQAKGLIIDKEAPEELKQKLIAKAKSSKKKRKRILA